MGRSSTTERETTGRQAVICSPGFVGRERELAALAEALVGEPAVILVEGEAGIGKTRLVKEFLASAAGKRLPVLLAACPPFRQPHTLGPVVDAVRQAANGRVRDLTLSGLAGALRPLFPEWAADLPPALESAEDATAARHRVFTALAELLVALDIHALVIEDVHWADEATLEFLLFLAAGQRRQVNLLVTCRPEEVPEGSLLRRLSRQATGATGRRLTLRPLTVDQTASLVSSMLAGEKVTDEFAAFLHERAEGLPLAVEESVRLMGDREDLAFRHGAWARHHLADIEVPPTLRDTVLERIARLSPQTVAILRAAAVLSEPSASSTMTAVADLESQGAQAGICEALACGLLTEIFPYGQGLAFRHALAARAVYETIPVLLRREMHHRAGQTLEDSPVPPLARLAQHFREAGDLARWVRYGEQAASSALAAGDHRSAATLLNDLVIHAALSPREAVRLAVKTPLNLLSPCEASQLVAVLRAILDRDGLEPDVEGEVRGHLGRVLMVTEQWDTAPVELERSIPLLRRNPGAAARAMTLLGWPIGWTDWPASKHVKWLRRAAEMSMKMPPAEELALRVDRMTALLMLGEEQGWAEATMLPADQAPVNGRVQIIRGILNVGNAALLWGRYAEAGHRLESVCSLAGAHGYLRLRDSALVSRARLDWYMGQWDGLAATIDALALDEHVPTLSQLEIKMIRGLLAAATARRADAEDYLLNAMEGARTHGSSLDILIGAAGALASLWLTGGQPGKTLQVTEEPIRIVAVKRVWLWAAEIVPARVAALLAEGREVEAAALVREFAYGLRKRDAPGPQAALAACRALVTESHGIQGQAARAYARAALAWQACPRPYDALLAQERQACCLLAAGGAEAGTGLLSQVLKGLFSLGAVGDADRVATTLRSHGVRVTTGRAGRRSYGNQLSPRELEVVHLLAAGQTNRQIAATLFLSVPTVIHHVKSARRKLNAPSRTALAVTAAESGLLASAEDTARA